MNWLKYLTEFLRNPPESYWKCTYVVGSINDVNTQKVIDVLNKQYGADDLWIFRGVPPRQIIKRMKEHKEPKVLLFDCLNKTNKQRARINYDVLVALEHGIDDRLGHSPSGMLYFQSPNHVVVFTHREPKEVIMKDGHTHLVFTDGRVQKFHQKGVVDENGIVQWEHNTFSCRTPENNQEVEASENIEEPGTFIKW